MPSYVVGVDFGTESGRAVVIDTADGRELGSSVYRYANGVIERSCRLPTMMCGWLPTGPCRTPRTTCAPISRPCRPRWRPPAWTPRWWWA